MDEKSKRFFNEEVSRARSFLNLKKGELINTIPLEDLNNKHKNKRAFIVGTAPTIDGINLNFMNDEITFGLNEIVTVFIPKYYVAISSGTFVPPENAIKAANSDIIFLNSKLWPQFKGILKKENINLPEEKRFLFFINNPKKRVYCPLFTQFESDIAFLRNGASCLFSAIQLAFAMGCDPIYLVGICFKNFSQNYFKNSLKVKPLTEFDSGHALGTIRLMKEQMFESNNRSLLTATPQNLFAEKGVIKEVKYDSLFL